MVNVGWTTDMSGERWTRAEGLGPFGWERGLDFLRDCAKWGKVPLQTKPNQAMTILFILSPAFSLSVFLFFFFPEKRASFSRNSAQLGPTQRNGYIWIWDNMLNVGLFWALELIAGVCWVLIYWPFTLFRIGSKSQQLYQCLHVVRLQCVYLNTI